MRRLADVARCETAPRGKGPHGYLCMRVGWTEWIWKPDRSGVCGERLTDEGMRVLELWASGRVRAGQVVPPLPPNPTPGYVVA